MEDDIVTYVTSIAGTAFFCGVGLFLILESIAPLRAIKVAPMTRWVGNVGLALINSLVLRWATALLGLGAAFTARENGWGLLNAFELPLIVEITASVLIVDLVLYVCHRLYHASDLLWRFHVVHHSDRAIDITTGLRFHPFEACASGGASAVAAVLFGISPAGLVIHHFLNGVDALFGHANLRTPGWLDRALSLVLVTPRFHHVHHAAGETDYNNNLGIVFTVWDRLFGTYRARDTAWLETMSIGVEGCETNRRFTLPWLLAQPFLSSGNDEERKEPDSTKEAKRFVDAK